MAEIKVKDPVSVVEGGETFHGIVVEVKEKDCVIQFKGGDPETHKIADVTLDEESSTKGKVSVEKQQAKLVADKAALEKQQSDLAEQQKELKEQQDQVNVNINKSITISDSQVDMGKFNKVDDPKAFAIEEAKQKANCEKRHANRIIKAKVAATMTPVQIREKLLRARLTKVRMKHHHTYKKEQIDLWAQELTIIIQTPDAWSKGCVKPKKQMGAMEKLDKMLGGD